MDVVRSSTRPSLWWGPWCYRLCLTPSSWSGSWRHSSELLSSASWWGTPCPWQVFLYPFSPSGIVGLSRPKELCKVHSERNQHSKGLLLLPQSFPPLTLSGCCQASLNCHRFDPSVGLRLATDSMKIATVNRTKPILYHIFPRSPFSFQKRERFGGGWQSPGS